MRENPSQPLANMAQIGDRLECHAAMSYAGMALRSTPAALVMRSRQLVQAAQALQARCDVASEALASDDGETQALAQFGQLSSEASAAFPAMTKGISALQQFSAAGDWDAEEMLLELHAARSKFRVSLLAVVRRLQKRRLRLERQGHVKEVALVGALGPLAAAEAEQEFDPHVVFTAGLFWSEHACARGPRSGFADRWALDARGLHVPSDVAKAEELLLRAEQEAEGSQQRSSMASVRAARLREHGKLLEKWRGQHDAAAEWRYTASAEIASAAGRPQVATSALNRLSRLHMANGRFEQAAVMAAKGVQLSPSDATARFWLATAAVHAPQVAASVLLREDGQHDPKSDVLPPVFDAARWELAELAGQLPSEDLEAQRVQVLREFEAWVAAKTGGVSACFGLHDAARTLICLATKVAYAI